MKKSIFYLVIALICTIFIPKVFAFDDYVVHTTKPVNKVVSSDRNIITANVLVTIMNEKDTILISPKGEGKAILIFEFKDETITVPVTVKKNKTIFKKNTGLEFVKLDPPPQLFQIDLPPRTEGVK